MTPRTKLRRESGFTIVEILVAVCIIAILVAGAMMFFSGAGRTQQKNLVRQKMSTAADGIGQQVRSTRDWVTYAKSKGCTVSKTQCDISDWPALAPLFKVGNGPKFQANVVVFPVDSKGDGIGDADGDHVVPDYYRIQVKVWIQDTAEQEKWGDPKPLDAASTVDAAALGRATGSITVQTCEVMNQVDERQSISNCSDGLNHLLMAPQPEPCANPFPLTWSQWTGLESILPLGCNAAYNEGRNLPLTGSHEAVNMKVHPVNNVTFSIQRLDANGAPVGTTYDSDDPLEHSLVATGTYVFTGLPAGSYRINIKNPGAPNREQWESHSIPSKNIASVQANQSARAMIVMRPKQGLGVFKAHFTRTVYVYHLRTRNGPTTNYHRCYYGTCINMSVRFVYLYASAPERRTWHGPAWTGLYGMEAKPSGRYVDPVDQSSHQEVRSITWKPLDLDRTVDFTGMATGLHSLPDEQPQPSNPPDDTWGDNGGGTHSCAPAFLPPGVPCGQKFAWMNAALPGYPDGTITFHSDDGECYMDSQTPLFPYAFAIQRGGTHATRCSRALNYFGVDYWSFLPNKNGFGGQEVPIRAFVSISCTNPSRCAASSPAPFRPSNGGPGPAGSNPFPPINPPSVTITDGQGIPHKPKGPPLTNTGK